MMDAVRHYCRSARCGMKLPEPVDNPRRAFCCRGCYVVHYRVRCIVCEKKLPPGPANRRLCRSAKCRNEYRRFPHLFAWSLDATGPTLVSGAGNVERPSENPIKLATEMADRATISPASWPLDLLGGSRHPGAPKLNPELRAAIVWAEVGGFGQQEVTA
jgi:hypothetical protein